MAQIDIKSYFQPTPALFRKIGDSILLLGTTLSATFAVAEMGKWFVVSTVLLTWFGKTITNFFTDTTQQS